MIHERCLGRGVDRSKIHPDAEITGASYLTGAETAVGAAAVVRDARLHDAVVASGATVIDSIVVAEGRPGTHKCDAAGRTVVSGAETPEIAAAARVQGCTLINTSVGRRSRVTDTWAKDVRFGPDNAITDAKLILTNTERSVTVTGPTEISEAWLGHGATIDRRGYYEGIFSNSFRQLRFDELSGKLKVIGTIELPHVSRYGINTVNSTNSGKLLPQPNGVLKDFGPHKGLWHIGLLSHEQIELGPCCWVAPWTKVIGQSAEPHADDEELLNDRLTTCLMPFAVAGVGGSSTNGLVMPGELSAGYGPKQRKGAWAFTYAPDLVIRMVKRLHEALEPERKAVADSIVIEAIKTAIEMTKALAAEHEADLTVAPAEQHRGWPRWIGTTHALLTAHLESGLWEFRNGDPIGWQQKRGRWTHPAMGGILALAPDALEKQILEEEIFRFDDPVPPAQVAAPSGFVQGSRGDPSIAPEAKIADDAIVGPGCIIGSGCEIGPGAELWNSVLENSKVESGARVERSVIEDGAVGAGSVVRSCRMSGATLGAGSTADAAAMTNSSLAEKTTVSAFANSENVQARYATILGGAFRDSEIDVVLMSMHMTGGCRHLRAVPTVVELDGRRVEVRAVPMIGGGALIRGSAEKPVQMECSFIGSNSIIEPGCYIGFGSFVLGTLGPDTGLLPFTVSTGGGPRDSAEAPARRACSAEAASAAKAGSLGAGGASSLSRRRKRHQIGAVLSSMPSTIITHFIEWAFQALGPQGGPAVARMTVQSIEEGIRAIEWELQNRENGNKPDPDSPYARYKSLAEYSENQLKSGLTTYQKALEQGCWELVFDGEKLVFASDKGRWIERHGSAFWVAGATRPEMTGRTMR